MEKGDSIKALIDSHCHFDFAEFDHARNDILRRCLSLPLAGVIIPGTERSRWPQLQALAHRYPVISYALGLHPYFLGSMQSDDLDALQSCLSDNSESLVALGEIGLDAAVDVDMSLQTEVFHQQLAIARQYQLPVILHQRKTSHLLLQALQGFEFGGVLHGFSGSKALAHGFLDLGFKLGVGGVITYPRANKTRQTVAQLPLDAMVLETDAPDMPVNGFQGQPNSPERLQQILACLTELRPESEPELRQALWHNTLQAFPLLQPAIAS